MCVIVPVRDEERTLKGTLRSLACQTTLEGERLPWDCYEVIVLANNCRDGSASVARRFAARRPGLRLHVAEVTLAPEVAHIGYARRALMDEACRRLALHGREDGVIASTDGDTRVAPTWLAATMREIERGADAVGGRILMDRADRAALGPAATLHLRDTGYRYLVAACEDLLDPVPYDPWPRHHQHFGASFAVTPRAYRRVGGVPPISALEDVALYRALVAVDARVRHSPHVRVVTSGRRSARTPMGLATQLAEWTQLRQEGQPWLVESATSVERRLRARYRLRVAWRHAHSGRRLCQTDRDGLAGELGTTPGWLDNALERRGPFGALLQAVEVYHHASGRPWEYGARVDIAEAVRDLRAALPRLASAAAGPDTRVEIEPAVIYPK